ncbi:MAG: hypothetical protein MUC95_04750 [Spirochaetes bacterium]|nr:hypothetical protein [Spirochaetota bacterium]
MNNIRMYEKSGFKSRMKDALLLSAIFITSFIISMITMDILVFPVALLAVNDGKAFTVIFKYTFRIFISAVFVYIISRMIYQLKKDGFPAGYIIKSIIVKPLLSLFFIIAVSLLCIILILFFNILYQNNYHLLYKLLNI